MAKLGVVKGPTAMLEKLVERFARAADGKVSEAATDRIYKFAGNSIKQTIAAKSNPSGKQWPLRSIETVERWGGGLGPTPGWGSGNVAETRKTPLAFQLTIKDGGTTRTGKPIAVVLQYGGKRQPRDAATGLGFASKKAMVMHVMGGGKLKRDGWKLPGRRMLPGKRVPAKWSRGILLDLQKNLPQHFKVR